MTRALNGKLCVALSLLALSACAGKGDIDRTQPDRLDKSYLFNADGTPKLFYYRNTIIGVPPTNSWSAEGFQSPMEKIYFKILNEEQLVGYRAYDYAPGSQNDFTGGVNNTDTPVVSFKIREHFDVQREYNPATGEQTNVISEDTRDRHWSERKYMRVDWSTDKLATPFFMVATEALGTTDVRQGDITSAERPIYSADYLDVTTRVKATPDYAACYALFDTWDDAGPWGCGPAEISVRHSFMAVKPSEYEPLEYPDRQPILDQNGSPIRVVWAADGSALPCDSATLSRSGGQLTGADCTEAAADQFAKFGFFRTVRQVYDPRAGATEVGRKYYANRWNIWANSISRTETGEPRTDADGKLLRLPYADRTVRQIPFYKNVEYPDDPKLHAVAEQVVSGWNDAFRRTVAALRLTQGRAGAVATEQQIENELAAKAPDGTPRIADVIVLKDNSCNLAGVQQHLTAHGDLAAELKRKTGLEASKLNKVTLVAACSAMEALTESLPATDAKKFAWQRNGDLRYSMFFWVDRPQAVGPLGYGPSSPDPETGEIISATLYNYGASLNTYAQFAADAVDSANGKLPADELLSGKRISDIVQETAMQRQAREAQPLTPEAREYARSVVASGGIPRAQTTPAPGGRAPGIGAAPPRLVKLDPVAVDAKLDALKGSAIEKVMMTDDVLAALVPGYVPGRTKLTDVDPRLLERASPLNWLSQRAQNQRRDRFQKLAMNGCLYMKDFADDAIMGTAMRLSHLSGEELFRTLRAEIFRGLAEHEMGHTVGLRHNFAGSTDALNYGRQYWQIRTGLDQKDWSAHGMEEHMYSSVMDYGARFNSDVHGLGRYDHAAIRFGYGQLVDIMPSALSAADQLRYEIYFGDYRNIPQMVGGMDALHETAVISYGDVVGALRDGYRNIATNRGSFGIFPERPYKFCSDEFEGNIDCKTWDLGASQEEIINNNIDSYRNYYIFHAYQRGRVSWNPDGYLNRLMQRVFNRYNEAFQFYYFFGDYFAGTYLADDLLKAAITSLNALGEVLETPEPGYHCATDTSPDILVVASGAGSQTCRNTAPRLSLSLPDAKPYYMDFSEDYYYRITRVGSLYEKLAALVALTNTQSRFFRVDQEADRDLFSINYYRLFKSEMLNLLSGVIRNDPKAYGGYIANGVYKPMPIVDLNTFGKANPPMPEYMQPEVHRVDTPVNKTIRYYALGLSLSQLNSTWDSTLDFSSYANVTLKGAIDDVQYAEGTVIEEFVHPETRLVYRAPVLDDKRTGIGVELIRELRQIVGSPTATGVLPRKYGLLDTQPLPDWHTAKAALTAAEASGNQQQYGRALEIFKYVDYLVSYRVDVLTDLRIFRLAFAP